MRKKFESAVAIAACAVACYCAYVAFARLCRTLSGPDGDLEKDDDEDEDDVWDDLDWEEGGSGGCNEGGCCGGKGKCGCPGGGCWDTHH